MENKTILHSYQHWLAAQKMPAGKKNTLTAAIELFSQQGYNGTSTAQIAERAGVSQATIFKYFKTKADLLSEIMQPLIPELKKEFLPQLQTYSNIEDAIHFIVQNRFHFLAQNADLIKIVIQEVLINSEFRQELMVAIEESAAADFVKFFQRLHTQNHTGLSLNDGLEIFRTGAGLLFAYFAQRFILNIPTQSEAEDLALIEQQILTLITLK